MYQPPEYISEDLVRAILSEFQWPAEFDVEDELPDGINLAFPKSNWYFIEGIGGRVSVEFLPEDTGENDVRLTIQDALEILSPEVDTCGYDFFDLPGEPSLDKISAGVRRCCQWIHMHLLSVVEGDFNWVEAAVKKRLHS